MLSELKPHMLHERHESAELVSVGVVWGGKIDKIRGRGGGSVAKVVCLTESPSNAGLHHCIARWHGRRSWLALTAQTTVGSSQLVGVGEG